MSAQIDEETTQPSADASPSPTPKKMRRMLPATRRGWVAAVLGVALLIGAGGFGAWWFFGRPQPAATTTRTVTVATSTLKQTLSASGTLQPARTADLSFAGSGKVTAVDVAVGDSVTSGQRLASIDPTSLQIAVSSAQADLTAAQQTLTDLKNNTGTTAAIKSATATVQVKQNALTTAQNNLSSATLTAPFDGVVATVNVAVGDAAGSSSGTSSGTSGGGSGGGAGGSGQGASSSGSSTSSGSGAAVVVISQGAYTVSTTVSSSDIASVKKGLQATITVPGRTDPLYGTVATVAVNATQGTTSGTASFPVTIDVTGTQTGLYAGSSVTAEIVTQQYTDVVAVSATALTTANGSTTVSKLVDGVATPTKVTTGATVNGETIIAEGLTAGDQIQVTSRNGTVRTTGNAQQGSTQQRSGQQGGFPQGGQGGGGFQPPNGGAAPNGNGQGGGNR